MSELQLVFVPSTGRGHLVPTVEFAKTLIAYDPRFSVTVLIIPSLSNPAPTAYTSSIAESFPSIHFTDLPPIKPYKPGYPVAKYYMEECLPSIRKTVTELMTNDIPIVGIISDMSMTHVIDVAKDLGIPAYIYCTFSLAMQGLALNFQNLDKEIDTDFKDFLGDLTIPSCKNPVPVNNIPVLLQTKGEMHNWVMYHFSRLQKSTGILVNSVQELEPFAFKSLINGPSPPVYTVGPLLESQSATNNAEYGSIMKWLDDQPQSSVIFLCFGSRGSFDEPQVKEIAIGLEKSGVRFLWALKQPSQKLFGMPTDYTSVSNILPDGFLERTSQRGMICSWAPQISVLAHTAVGGFVSHCGWNSILESLWYGVPILTWPLYSEQNMNAFELVKELGLAEELRLFHSNVVDLVTAEEVERGVQCIMRMDSTVRQKVMETKDVIRNAKCEEGSSFKSLRRFVCDVTATRQL